MNRAEKRRNKKLANKGVKKAELIRASSTMLNEQEQTLTMKEAIYLALQLAATLPSSHASAPDVPQLLGALQNWVQSQVTSISCSSQARC